MLLKYLFTFKYELIKLTNWFGFHEWNYTLDFTKKNIHYNIISIKFINCKEIRTSSISQELLHWIIYSLATKQYYHVTPVAKHLRITIKSTHNTPPLHFDWYWCVVKVTVRRSKSHTQTNIYTQTRTWLYQHFIGQTRVRASPRVYVHVVFIHNYK